MRKREVRSRCILLFCSWNYSTERSATLGLRVVVVSSSSCFLVPVTAPPPGKSPREKKRWVKNAHPGFSFSFSSFGFVVRCICFVNRNFVQICCQILWAFFIFGACEKHLQFSLNVFYTSYINSVLPPLPLHCLSSTSIQTRRMAKVCARSSSCSCTFHKSRGGDINMVHFLCPAPMTFARKTLFPVRRWISPGVNHLLGYHTFFVLEKGSCMRRN